MLLRVIIFVGFLKVYETTHPVDHRIVYPKSSEESFEEIQNNFFRTPNHHSHHHNEEIHHNFISDENSRNNEMNPPINSNQEVTYDRDASRNNWNSNEHASESSNVKNMRNNGRRNRNRQSGKRQKQRLCEQKYMEYMTQIFHDEEITADGSDTDFDGRVLVEPGEYPHMAALGFAAPNQPIDYKCGGSLISERFVVTAAHCANQTGQTPFKIRIGDLNLQIEERYLKPQMRNITRIYTHPDYQDSLYYNDIALLELDSDVEFTEFVRPIKLWVDDNLPAETIVHAMGYGATSFGKARTNRLTDLNMTIVPNDICNNELPVMSEAPSGILASQVCARDFLMNTDTCQGDSGGPLQLNLRGRRKKNRKHYHLIGITSYGIFCRSSYPSVYTRISFFLDWIERIVWGSQN